MKILIVDDDDTNVKLLFTILKDFGNCYSAKDGKTALESIQRAMEGNSHFDLICLDIMMPEIDGIETLKTIRELEESTFNVSGKRSKIIMVSALDDIETIMIAFREFCDGYLTKPIRREDMIGKLKEVDL